MTYTVKHVVDCSTGETQEVALTPDEIAALEAKDAEWAAGQAAAALAAEKAAFVQSAQTALDKSDVTVLRCVSTGVVVPTEWQTYRIALRNIINGTDTSSTYLPTVPQYPSGT